MHATISCPLIKETDQGSLTGEAQSRCCKYYRGPDWVLEKYCSSKTLTDSSSSCGIPRWSPVKMRYNLSSRSWVCSGVSFYWGSCYTASPVAELAESLQDNQTTWTFSSQFRGPISKVLLDCQDPQLFRQSKACKSMEESYFLCLYLWPNSSGHYPQIVTSG